MLWSPVAGKFNGTDVSVAELETNLEQLFCNLSHPVKLHFQDYLGNNHVLTIYPMKYKVASHRFRAGQSVTFEFPFKYNYSAQYTCEGDTVPYLRLLQRVSHRCPNLQEVKVNMEVRCTEDYNSAAVIRDLNFLSSFCRFCRLPVLHLWLSRCLLNALTTVCVAKTMEPIVSNPSCFLLSLSSFFTKTWTAVVNADPAEISRRMACYKRNDAPIGASWAMPHWYYLMTYSNATVYSPY
eukprot:SAG31_NODE_501_length_14835_cov_11.191979_6_plen_238_part_00